ncbi:MAG: PKD domain-containing protein [Blastocatellia bacterium]
MIFKNNNRGFLLLALLLALALGGNSSFTSGTSARSSVGKCMPPPALPVSMPPESYTVAGWGDNSFAGQLNIPAGLSGVTAISAGGVHSLALKSDGTVVGWGENTNNQATPPVGLSGVVAISAGTFHSLALKSDGTVVGWGSNDFGQATPPASLSGVVAISAGGLHSLALKSNGTVVGWGYNEFCQATPPGCVSNPAAISAGGIHSLAMQTNACVQIGCPVLNTAPVVTITGPASGSIFAVNTPVNFTGTFTDAAGDTHTATWAIGSATQAATVIEPFGSTPGSANTTYTFTEAGVYNVSLRVTDNGNLSGVATTVGEFDALVVAYDPSAGWVTGGGWINSPAGAYVPNPSLTGKANFGFVSKYKNGASVPTGNTEFQFKSGNLNFSSTSYEWMVISGGKKAQYKGFGKINNSGNYRFMLTAIDGDKPGGGGQDKFRIRIWSDGGGLVYDNQMNDPDSNDPTTVLGGGSIVIHN